MNYLWLVFIMALSIIASGGEQEQIISKTEVWLLDCSLRSLITEEKINDEIKLQEKFRPIIEQGGYSLRYGYVVNIVVVLKPIIENEELTFVLERMIFNDYDSLEYKERTEAAVARKVLELLPEFTALVDKTRLDPSCEKIVSIMKLRVCS